MPDPAPLLHSVFHPDNCRPLDSAGFGFEVVRRGVNPVRATVTTYWQMLPPAR